jgi:phosphatidylserine/phosphatidylglycerophosphate/cardiolipin synthase-like enzyme
MKLLYLMALVMLFNCKTRSQESTVKDISSETAYFQVPNCLPNCTKADQSSLVANSPIEARLVKSIVEAKTSIQFSMYTFSRKPIFEALIAAIERGVRVQGVMDRAQFKTTKGSCKAGGCDFLVEGLGSDWSSLGIRSRLERVAELPLYRDGTNTDKLAIVIEGLNQGSGIRPLPGGDRLVHNKYIMVDGSLLLSGSGNWSSTAVSVNLENLVSYNRDDFPEVLAGIQCSFALFWQGDPNIISQKITACQSIDHLYLSPSPKDDAGPQARVLKAINEATTQIDVAMHHLADPDVFVALEMAATRGIKIRLVVDDDDCNEQPEAKLESLLAAGATIRFVPTTCSIFQLSHSKYGIFDKSVVINGSANWSKAGLKRNYENFVVLRDPRVTERFNNNFDTLWNIAVEKSACMCDTTTAACQEKYCLSEAHLKLYLDSLETDIFEDSIPEPDVSETE